MPITSPNCGRSRCHPIPAPDLYSISSACSSCGRLKVREFGRALAKRKQKVGQFASLLQPAAIEIVMPAERDGAALAKEAVEFEFLEG